MRGQALRARGPVPMKPSASRIERMLEKIEAKLVPPKRKWLQVIFHEGDDEAVVKEKQEKAGAEPVNRNAEGVGRMVEDFKWILEQVVKWSLQVIINEGDDEAVVKEKQEKALAEHVARHPEHVGRTVEDFKWIMHVIVRPAAKGVYS